MTYQDKNDSPTTLTRRSLLQVVAGTAGWAGLGALGAASWGMPAIAKSHDKAATVLFMLADSSNSNNKYDVIVQGTGQAFHDEQVLDKIDYITRSVGPILIAYYDFASPALLNAITGMDEVELSVVERLPLTLIAGREDARRFGDAVVALPRVLGGYTHTVDALLHLYHHAMKDMLSHRSGEGISKNPLAHLIGPHTQFVIDLTADDPPLYGYGPIDVTVAEAVARGETVEDRAMQSARDLMQRWGVTANTIVFGGTTGRRSHAKVKLPYLQAYFQHNLQTPDGHVWTAERPEDFTPVMARKLLEEIAAKPTTARPT